VFVYILSRHFSPHRDIQSACNAVDSYNCLASVESDIDHSHLSNDEE